MWKTNINLLQVHQSMMSSTLQSACILIFGLLAKGFVSLIAWPGRLQILLVKSMAASCGHTHTAAGLLLSYSMLIALQVMHRSEEMLPDSAVAVLAALPKHLLVQTDGFAAAFNTSGPVSRQGPQGLAAASQPAIASFAGLLVRYIDLLLPSAACMITPICISQT